MHDRRNVSRMNAALVAITGLAAGALAQEYRFTLVDAPAINHNLRETYLWDVAESGVAAGMTTNSTTVNGNTTITIAGCYWQGGVMTILPFLGPRGVSNAGLVVGTGRAFDIPTGQVMAAPAAPGLSFTPSLQGVNDAGLVVGYEQTCSCSNSQGLLQVPYVWNTADGTARAVTVPGSPAPTGLSRVNIHGMAVGWCGGRASPDSFIADLITGQTTRIAGLFPPPPDQYTRKTTADDVSDNGVVVGSRLGDDLLTTYGYVWDTRGGVPVLLPLPPAGYGQSVRPLSINSQGVIVGAMTHADGTDRAFVYDPARAGLGLRDLNAMITPSAGAMVLRQATRVNDRGEIVGWGQGGGGFSKSFVLTPLGGRCGTSDFNGDGDFGTDQDIEAFFACLAGSCCGPCFVGGADFNGDGDTGTDQDIEAFFRVLSGGAC